jgi:hypothetical protein
MYGLPKDFDASFLIGREVESICFAQYQVNFRFSDGVWIQIEGAFKHFQQDDLIEVAEGFPIQQSSLMRMLGQKVVAVNFSVNGDINLTFSNGNKLFIAGECGPYEAYIICNGKKEIIV